MDTTRIAQTRARLLAAGLALALLALAAAGCNPMSRGAGPGGTPGGNAPTSGGSPGAGGPAGLERPDLDTLPEAVRAWYEANHRTQGVYRLNHGGKTYVLVAWGEKPTGGFAVTIRGFEEQKDVLVGTVDLVAPGPNDMVIQVLTYPADLVALSQTEKLFAYEFEGPDWVAPAAADVKAVPLASTTVFIDLPAPGAIITNPVRIRGVARMYEATLQVTLEDGHMVLAEKTITTSDAAPAWGTFDIELAYDAPTQAHGMLIFWHEDAADGRRVEDLGVPVKFGD